MKQMISWRERPMGSPADYESAQSRILSVFKHWKQPESFKVLQWVIRVGDWGGYLLVETTDVAAIHQLSTMLPSFEFRVEQCMDLQDAIKAELDTMAWRSALPAN
jgi:muconolactone delta-isomerase